MGGKKPSESSLITSHRKKGEKYQPNIYCLIVCGDFFMSFISFNYESSSVRYLFLLLLANEETDLELIRW